MPSSEEYLRGVRLVQAFDREAHVIEAMRSRSSKVKAAVEYRAERLAAWFGYLVIFGSTLATVLILGFGGAWVMARPDLLSIGTLVAFLGYVQRLIGPMFMLSEQLGVIPARIRGRKADSRTFSISAGWGAARRSDRRNTAQPEPPALELRNVWFAYEGERWVLRDVSFALRRGGRLGLMGPTGSGKTTIVSLLFRFYEPQRGQILLDGIDIRTIPVATLRRKLGLVLRTSCSSGTILDNLRLFDSDARRGAGWLVPRGSTFDGRLRRDASDHPGARRERLVGEKQP